MDTVRNGFFLGELYVHSCYSCGIRNDFLYGKTKEKVYIISVPEYGEDLYGKNLIINKSLYGIKISAAKFHVRWVESDIP
jgi:hypothetical protein